MCPICGYMMFPQPYDRSEVIISEIRRFVERIVAQKIDVQSLPFGKLKEDMHRFPSFSKIKTYVSRAEKTEIFYHRLKTSLEQTQQYFHETFCKRYSSKNDTLDMLSDRTSALLQSVLLKLGIEIQWKKAVFPTVTVQYTEVPHQDYIHLADQLLDRIVQLSDKINQFIKANNIYGCAYDQEIEPPKMQKNHTEINWQEVLSKHISACDSILKKKYVIDIFEDGSTELTAMLKVAWDDIFVLLSAPIKKRTLVYAFDHEELSAEQCNNRLMEIFSDSFHAVMELVQAENFLKDQSEEQLFELYQNMLDLDKHHYMSGTKGNFKIGKWEKKLNALIGLDAVKSNVRKIKAYALANKGHDQPNLHMCFLGNPGTGKTEVARILSRILYEAGVLPEAKLTETDAQGLISKYVGGTASKTLAKINDAMGGILFIDEAYSLIRSDDDNAATYGEEAIAVLLKQMEDQRGQFCVILAGYPSEMEELIRVNPGLASRVQFTLHFQDYTREELEEIALHFLKRKGYEMDSSAMQLLLDITEYYRTKPNFANARTVRNILEQVIMNQNLREDEKNQKDNLLILSDVQDYLDDENIDLNRASVKLNKIGF